MSEILTEKDSHVLKSYMEADKHLSTIIVWVTVWYFVYAVGTNVSA